MTISCAVDYTENEASWYYSYHDGLSIYQGERGKRCCSCKSVIHKGDTHLKFPRWRYPRTKIEDKIYGEDGEITLAPWAMCSTCAPAFVKLDGMNVSIILGEDNVQDLLAELDTLEQRP